jgi:hypothetical protein
MQSAAPQCAMRQGERSVHVFNAADAHAVSLSVWQTLHAFGIPNASVCAGVTKWKVWLLTLMLAMVCSILGIWQATHWLPVLSGL